MWNKGVMSGLSINQNGRMIPAEDIIATGDDPFGYRCFGIRTPTGTYRITEDDSQLVFMPNDETADEGIYPFAMIIDKGLSLDLLLKDINLLDEFGLDDLEFDIE